MFKKFNISQTLCFKGIFFRKKFQFYITLVFRRFLVETYIFFVFKATDFFDALWIGFYTQ